MKNYSTTADQVLHLVAEKSSCFKPKGRILDSNVKVRVYRPRKSRSKKEKEEEEEVLVVYGIDVKKDMYVKFDVYVNLVLDGNDSDIKLGPESREFAGTYVDLAHGVTKIANEGDTMIKTKRKTNLKLGISELLGDLKADEEDSILVTLVPRTGSGANTTVDGVRIDYMPRYTQ
ncbi:hypothetical protein MKW94_004897 [Papaver nudicaule]|uniref:Polyphenol oxidase C-terminal domain-containing protein n=1 Tax=Papaver nudicaule TaxID=74823 RepID=A0AA41S952_PAPNU|nr:hypothetical protein [Papaver nudicaule]